MNCVLGAFLTKRFLCVCVEFALRFRCVCVAFALSFRCVSVAFAFRFRCVCVAFALRLRLNGQEKRSRVCKSTQLYNMTTQLYVLLPCQMDDFEFSQKFLVSPRHLYRGLISKILSKMGIS